FAAFGPPYHRRWNGSTSEIRSQPRLCLRGPFVENGAHSFAIEPQTESILRCKLRNLCLPIFLILWPKAFQVPLVNRAVLPLAVHFAFDLSRQRFLCFAIYSLHA